MDGQQHNTRQSSDNQPCKNNQTTTKKQKTKKLIKNKQQKTIGLELMNDFSMNWIVERNYGIRQVVDSDTGELVIGGLDKKTAFRIADLHNAQIRKSLHSKAKSSATTKDTTHKTTGKSTQIIICKKDTSNVATTEY